MTRQFADFLKNGKLAVGAMIAVFVLIAGAVLFSGKTTINRWPLAQKTINVGRLISYEPLPGVEGEMCQWVPAALPQEQRLVARAATADIPDAAKRAEVAKRKHARMIQDSYASYSSVAVDIANNEVVMTDENLFGILVYDRLANTPPNASMTEPKRRLYGEKTKIEYQCGLYIDPRNGDIYAVNNDTVDTLVIFPRGATGDVTPARELETPHGTFGIAVDEDAQEMFLTIQHDSAVVVYRKLAQGKESPIRLLQGDSTRLADPHGIALDTKNNLIYVSNHGSWHQVDPATGNLPPTGFLGFWEGKNNWPLGLNFAVPGSGENRPASITVYAKTAKGDTPPLRVIEGPKTQMDWPSGIAVDPDRDEIYVANDVGDSVLVFPASASGDTAPIRVLKGPKSLVKNPTGLFLDKKNNELWVSNFGNHTATVYKATAQGDTPPLRVIRSAPLDAPATMFSNPFSNAFDEKRDQILVPN